MPGPDGGGPPPQETGASQAPKIEPQSETPETSAISAELAARKQRVLSVLNKDRFSVLGKDEAFEGIYKSWIEEVRENVDPAVTLSAAAGMPSAEIDAGYEASLDSPTDFRFSEAYFADFDAHVTIGANRENLSLTNAVALINNPGIKRVPQEAEGEIPEFEGTGVVVDSAGKPLYLVAETDIPGVRIILKGTGILIPDHPASKMKMSLLIKTSDGMASGEEEEKNLFTVLQETQDQRRAEISQMSDTDLNNKITEFNTSIEQLVKNPDQKKFLTEIVEGLRAKDRSQITPEQLKLIDTAIGNVSSPEQRKKLRGILGILLVGVMGIGKDFIGGTGIAKMPQQGR